MIDANIALAFGAGLVAAFNPCGFAMLPAYLSYFLGTEGTEAAGAERSTGEAVLRGASIAVAVSAGFMAVFGLAGILVTGFSLGIQEHLPWFTIVIGVLLVPLGIALLAGAELKLSLPRLERGGHDQTRWSMFLFGVSYAVVSLSCTLPVFLAAVAGTFRSASLASGMAVFVAYSAGMALVLTVLTMALALARAGMVGRLRRVLPLVNRLAGGLLVVAGSYVAYYGWVELQVIDGNVDAFGGPAEWVTDTSADLQQWVTEFGSLRLGLIVAGVAVVAATMAAWWRGSTAPSGSPASTASGGREGPDGQADATPEGADQPDAAGSATGISVGSAPES